MLKLSTDTHAKHNVKSNAEAYTYGAYRVVVPMVPLLCFAMHIAGWPAFYNAKLCYSASDCVTLCLCYVMLMLCYTLL